MHKRFIAGAIASLVVAAVSVVLTASAASATDGSTPVEVTNYVGSNLTARLSDLYGPGVSGKGVRFDSSTTYSPTDRVFVFTSIFDGGKTAFSTASPAIPARRLNQWITAVSVRKALVGVATLSYSTTDGAQLVSFSPDLRLARALGTLPASAQLIHDSAHKAWGSLVGDTVTPIEAGTTKLTGPTSLASYPRPPAKATQAVARTGFDPGVLAGGITLALIVVIIALALLLPRRKRPDPLA